MGVFYETIPKSLFEWVSGFLTQLPWSSVIAHETHEDNHNLSPMYLLAQPETTPLTFSLQILAQKIFWVATAPLSASGHVNLSPKGGSYFGVIDERTFWYMELTGSGIETVSHLHERGNGRITVLFNAFEGGPRIVRLWGKGTLLSLSTSNSYRFVKSVAGRLLTRCCRPCPRKPLPPIRRFHLPTLRQNNTRHALHSHSRHPPSRHLLRLQRPLLRLRRLPPHAKRPLPQNGRALQSRQQEGQHGSLLGVQERVEYGWLTRVEEGG